ncbi:MAG: hypothetical protein U0361_10925 [Nitrospiraceae bacterium]
MRGQNNVQGASDVGCLPTYFAGHQPFDDPVLQASIRPSRALPRARHENPGHVDAALAGTLKGLWIVGMTWPEQTRNSRRFMVALKRLDCLIAGPS